VPHDRCVAASRWPRTVVPSRRDSISSFRRLAQGVSRSRRCRRRTVSISLFSWTHPDGTPPPSSLISTDSSRRAPDFDGAVVLRAENFAEPSFVTTKTKKKP